MLKLFLWWLYQIFQKFSYKQILSFNVSESSFLVECDFEVSEKNNLTYLIPKIISQPDFIKSVKIIPKEIDFLIQK